MNKLLSVQEVDMDFLNYGEKIGALTKDQRLCFYEHLAHHLTLLIRCTCLDDKYADAVKVFIINALNDILHTVIDRITVIRLNLYEHRDEDVGSFIAEDIQACPGIRCVMHSAINSTLSNV